MEARSLMNLARLEAFSDGVFAFAATLLVIEFKVPDLHHATAQQAMAALGSLGRPFLAYATSFFVIGVIWLNHHPIFKELESVDRWTVVLNLIVLGTVAFLPFPTSLIAEYGELAPIVAFYGCAQAALGVAFLTLWIYVEERYRIDESTGHLSRAMLASRLWGAAYPVSSLIAAALAFVNPSISIVIYAAVPVAYLVPSAVERQLSRKG